MIKNCTCLQIYWGLPVKKPKIRFHPLIPKLLFQLSSFLLLAAISSSAWGQFFESPPRVIDDANEDTVFSPNGDGVQDNLIISFVTNGFLGDYRIVIDVHGPGAIGQPDGRFDIEDDWFVKGKVGSGQMDLEPPDAPKIIHQEWDGMDRAPSQETPPNARPVANGSYQIRVETDAFEDGVVSLGEPTYYSSTLTAVIDADAPQISSTISRLSFSPNGDAIKDTTTVSYTLSEHLSNLNLEFANLESQPAIELTHIASGRQSFVWNGQDGLRTSLVDGTYDLRLRGIDSGGNVTTFDIGAVQIDTNAPTFSQITPSQSAYLKTSVTTIVAEFNPAEQESPIDFDSSVTTISLQDEGGEPRSGITRSDVATNSLTLTLDNPLDTISENGTYTAFILGADEAGNQFVTESNFNFDTVPPTLEQIRSDNDDFRPNGSVNTEITFVEVDLDDNIDGGLNLSAATIALNGPGGAIFGNQTFGGDSTLRWDLKVPLVTDGSEDGIYTIAISAADRAGNTADFGDVAFVYDTQVPRLVSLTPNFDVDSFHLGGGAIFRSQPLSRVVAGFSDGDGSGVDFASTRLEIFSTGETGVDEISLTGPHHPNRADGTLAFLLSPPLENQDGSQDGAYIIRVTLVDAAGNTDTSQVSFIYDTETPMIVSTTPERDATVAMLSEVTLLLDDRLSGVDFSGTSIRLVRDDVEVRATSSNNGKDKTVLTLSDPLATDGSDDGEYRIEITPVDRAGNASVRIERRFFFTSQRPEIRLNAPAKEEVNALTTIDAQLFDYVGSGIDFSAEKSTVVVTRADDTVVPAASVEADKVNNRLLWMAETPLPRDGSADGVYTVSVSYEDLVGQNFTQDFALTFDTQLPNVVQTTPAAGARVAQLGTIAVKFATDLSGVDFPAAQVRLLDPNGLPVGTNRSDNGVDIITLRVQDLQTSAADGVYTIEVTSADRAGNVADSPFLSGFTYTPHEPLISLQPSGNLPTSQLNQITATLEDYVGPGINFDTAETTISVRDTNGAVITARPIQSNQAELQLTWTALSHLPRDGSADGEYKVVSRFVENLGLGTSSPSTFEQISILTVDTQPAQTVSTVPTQDARITQLKQATIVLRDNLSGVDFNRTVAQLLDSVNNPIPTSISNDGAGRITLSFDPFRTDGSADGVYRLEITPVDLAGNVGGLSTVEFVYATQGPEIEILTPSDESIVNRVPEIRVLVRDHSGEGIDFEKSKITLTNTNNADVLGVLRNDDEGTLTLEVGLPTDGTADGRYTVNLNLVDNRGVEAAYTRQFTYDSVPPIVVAASRPPGENRINDNRIIVEFEVTDASPVPGAGSGVDFNATTIQLQDANGEPIAGETKDDGVKIITFTSAELTSVGVYSLTVMVADRAGNVSVPQRFAYGDLIKPPRVASISPPTKSRVNRLTEISTVLEDQSGTGIDFSPTGSTVELRSPNDVVVGGIITDDGADTMTLKLIAPLLTDGGDDGIYTITVQPVDQLGVSGEVRQFTITYDTRNPRIQSVSHIDMTANESNVNDLVRRVESELIDNGSGIDFERSYVQLWRHTESERVLVPGTVDDDGSLLWWQLDSALARSGVDDGAYSVEVKAVDNAGNVEEKEFRLIYDTRAPVISSVHASVVAGDTLELDTGSTPSVVEAPIHQIHLVLSDGSGSGIDVPQTTVQLVHPNGAAVGATQQDNGAGQITLSFDPFKTDGSADGVYRLDITPVDLAGNVGGLSTVEFVYATQGPEIEVLAPADDSVVNRVPEIHVLIRDHSGEGIDFEKSKITLTITLTDTNNADVHGILRNDGERTLTLEVGLPTDGTADGRYTVNLNLVDNRGVEAVYTRQFTYDSVPPTVVAASRPPGENRINDNRIIVEFEVTDSSPIPGTGSGVDFDATTIQLQDSNGEPIPGETKDDGVKIIAFTSTELTSVGVYTLTVVVADRAGNVSVPQRFTYRDLIKPPRVASISPPAKSRVNRLTEISTVLEDQSGTGIDFSPTGSTVELRSPNDVVVGGTVVHDGVDTMTLKLIDPLLTDGGDDGVYTITVQPVDQLGVNGEVRQFTITYDTQNPRIQSVSHIDMTANESNVNELVRRVESELIDDGSGIDFERSYVQLWRHTESERVLVPGTVDDDGSLLWWQLDSPLVRSGSDDGVYSVEVRAVDNAGNIKEKGFRLLYDTQAPVISSVEASVVAGDTLELDIGSTPNDNRIIVEFEVTDSSPIPGTGSGVDFDATTIQLQDSNGEPIPGETKDDGVKIIAFTSTELTSVGVYTLTVVVADRAGNVSVPQRFTYRDLIKPPRVASISPPAKSRVNRLTEISTVLEDQSGTGIDFSPTGSTVELRSPNDVVVGGTVVHDGVDTMTLKLIDPLLTDGGDDGVYTITVQPVDQLGVNGEVRQFTITYDTQNPRIQSVSHIDMTANESNVNELVRRVESELIDDGSGIDFERSYVQLWRHTESERVLVPGTVDDDGSLLWWQLDSPLVRSGSDDGVYSVEVRAVDNAGNIKEKGFRLLYDTQAPVISSVEASVVAGDTLELDIGSTPNDNRIIVEFEVTDSSPIPGTGSGVDFDATTIQLQDSNGEPIPGETKDDGVKIIAFTSTELTSVGVYTLTVVVADRAGNVSVPQRFTYRDLIKPPRVASISPPAKSRVNRLTEISTVLEDQSGTGIDFSPTGSTVELRSPNDVVVGGTVVHDGVDTMTLKLIDPLLTDGGDDGVYTITVQPVDQLGVNGEVRQFTITYDTQNPRIQSVSHIDMTANESNVNELVRRVESELIDDGSGIDFERSYVQLWRHTESERVLVPGTVDDDGSLLWWQLDSPLVRSGSDDGVYSVEVKAVDNAGNIKEKGFRLLYDTQAPVISSVEASVVAGDTLELDIGSTPSLVEVPIHQIHLDFSDGSGSGIDVSQTTVQLIHSNGMGIASTQQNDGIETVSLRFNPLRNDGANDGRYLIQVTPIDLAGNTFTSPVEFQFFYATRKPEIVSTTPAEFTSVNLLNSVSAVLLDYSGEGIDFDRSTIGLHNSDGNLIDGRQHVDAEDSVITWELDQPLSRDGVDDGEYSIRLVAFNGVGSELKSSKTFLYDTQIPQIVSASAGAMPSTSIPVNGLEVLNQSFAQMTVRLSDERTDIPDEGQIPTSGIDFVGTVVRLLAPNNVQKGVSVGDDGEAQLFVSFAPLVQPGAYTLEITPRDLAGNTSGHPIQYNFSLDLAKPRVDSVAIGEHTAPVAFVNQLEQITAKLVDPNGVGLDLTTGGSTLGVMGPNGVVEGLQEGDGIDELVWTPLYLPSDGTADGRYTVTVTPVDSLGLSGTPARYQFILDTQKPELISAAPINLTQAVSFIGEQVIQISAQVTDVGPAGLDMLTQELQLQDSNGSSIPADLTSDDDTQVFLTLAQSLATNGSDDGEYTVIISLADRAGNTLKIEHTFVYDTQAPTLVNTDPAGDLIRDDLISITADLTDRGGSGIDFAVSQLTLFDPSGNQVNGKLSNDGVGQLILQLDELAEDGSYRIRVLAVDRAGNGVSAPFDRTFLFSTNLPTVVSTIPVTAPADSAFTRTSPNQVEVEFQSSPNLSTVKLIHPNGTTVPGQQIRDVNRLIYRLSRELASDGSDDGSYTIVVIPVNSAGRSGEQQQYNFIYDTVLPEVDGILPVVESPGVNNALNELLAAVTDANPSSTIDWDELDDSWMTLEKIGAGKKILGRLSTDRDQIISFRLESPLASDGSQDGEYRVTVMPRDRAGNVAIPTLLEFYLDTRPPIIHTDSLLINDRPLFANTNHPDYPSADGSGSGVVIQARMSDLGFDGKAGLGVDLSQSSIVVTAPDGASVNGNLIQNGTDTIVFRSGPLITQGFYQVKVTSVGLDVDGLGFAPTDSITTQFLHETTEPIAELTDFGGKTNLTDQPLPLRGTATDPVSAVEETGNEQGGTISASGIAFVEIVGTGPDGEPIEPVLAVDKSSAAAEPWSSWSLDFLPARSGGYNLDIRVTDQAGNVAVYDGVNVNLSVSLTYRGSTYGWPNPLKHSTGDRAHFSFDVNIPSGAKINMTLSIYDFAGDLVFENMFSNIAPGRDSDQLVTWNLENQTGAAVARGVYVFRLEAEDIATKNRSNAVGKLLVIE